MKNDMMLGAKSILTSYFAQFDSMIMYGLKIYQIKLRMGLFTMLSDE